MRITSSTAATTSFHILTASSPLEASSGRRGKRVSFIHGIEFPGASGDRNLPNLVLIRRNLVFPVASSFSSELGIANEDDDTLTELPYQDDLRTVHVRLELRRECQFGEQFLVAGDHPVLGSWSPLEAAPMEWTDGHVWTAELDLRVGELIQFKFILRGISGDILWQPGPNRVFETRETSKIIVVFGDWEKVAVRQVTEEQKDDIQDEESDEVMIHGEQQSRDDAAGSNNEEQLSDVESYNGDIASLNGQEMATVVESIAQHTHQDSGYLREELKVERKVEISSINQVVAQRFNSHAVNEEVAVSNKALKRSEVVLETEQEFPVLVHGLTPCLIMPTEDAIAMEEELKLDTFDNAKDAIVKNCEPECLHVNGQNQIQLDPKQEEVEGYRENEEEAEEEASTELLFDKGHAQIQLDPKQEKEVEGYREDEEEEAVIAELLVDKEHPDKAGFVSCDEPVQELQLTIYVGQDNRNNILHNHIRQGQETLRRFLNKLGFQ